jgi:hypothetical protein
MADGQCRLGSCGMIIARKVAAGSTDFNAAIVSYPSIDMGKADQQVIRPYMYTYVCPLLNRPEIADNQFYCTVVIDAILTVGIAFGLWKSKTGWSHTDYLIKRIIMCVCFLRSLETSYRVMRRLTDSYTVETQLLPTLAAITMSVQYSINNSTFMAFMYM